MEVEEGAVVSQMEELENVSMEGAEAEGKGRYMMVVQDGPANAKFVGVVMILEVMLSPTRVSP
jgi:hypothetical protein